MNLGIFILLLLVAVSWWISNEVTRLKTNKELDIDDELKVARIMGVLEE